MNKRVFVNDLTPNQVKDSESSLQDLKNSNLETLIEELSSRK